MEKFYAEYTAEEAQKAITATIENFFKNRVLCLCEELSKRDFSSETQAEIIKTMEVYIKSKCK